MMEGTLPFTNADRTWPRLRQTSKQKNNNKKAKRNMKTITKTVLYLQMTVLLLTAALAGPAAAGKEVPFRGSFRGLDITDVQFPKLFVDGSASGKASHLGRFTMTYELEVDLLTLPIDSFGSSVFTAANGDSLFTDIVGLATPTENARCRLHCGSAYHHWRYGSIRGRHGEFHQEVHLDLITLVSSGSFDGTIAFGKAK